MFNCISHTRWQKKNPTLILVSCLQCIWAYERTYKTIQREQETYNMLNTFKCVRFTGSMFFKMLNRKLCLLFDFKFFCNTVFAHTAHPRACKNAFGSYISQSWTCQLASTKSMWSGLRHCVNTVGNILVQSLLEYLQQGKSRLFTNAY